MSLNNVLKEHEVTCNSFYITSFEIKSYTVKVVFLSTTANFFLSIDKSQFTIGIECYYKITGKELLIITFNTCPFYKPTKIFSPF